MDTLFYSTGKAALALGVTQERIRDLCSTGAIQAESSPGGQWRVGRDELERLKRDGVPPTPRPLPGDSPRPSPARLLHGHPALLAEPSEEVIQAAEGVVVLENEVKAIGLRRQKEQGLDWFREREDREAARMAAQEQEKAERKEAERRQGEADRRRQARVGWESQCVEYALGLMPREAQGEVELELHEQVRAALSQVPLNESEPIVQRIVAAIVARVLKPWTREQNIRKAAEEAIDTLPFELKGYSWSPTQAALQTREVATAAVRKLRPEAGYPEMRAAAIDAVQPIIAAYEDQKMRRDVLLWARLPDGLTPEGKELATQAIAEAIGKLPPGTPRARLEQVREQEVLAPLRTAIVQVREQKRKQAEEARLKRDREREEEETRSRVEYRVGRSLSDVDDYLFKLGRKGEITFDSAADYTNVSERLKAIVRPSLMKALLAQPGMTDEEIRKHINRLADEHLEEVAPTA